MILNEKIIGQIGEKYVEFKLSTLGIKTLQMPSFFDFDIITQNCTRIEVKTSSVVTQRDKRINETYSREYWQFLNFGRKTEYLKNKTFKYTDSKRDRNCDFFIFVCLNSESNVESCYIVPKEKIGERIAVTIPRNPKTKAFRLREFKEKWEQII